MRSTEQSPHTTAAAPCADVPERRRQESQRPPLSEVAEFVVGRPCPRALALLLDELDPRT